MSATSMQILRRFALRLPETDEGVACEGTTLESRTIRRKNKAFLFLRSTELRLKLAASLNEAVALAAQEPTRYSVGAHGWVLVKLDGKSDPVDVIKRWTEESYSLIGSMKSTSATSSASGQKTKSRNVGH